MVNEMTDAFGGVRLLIKQSVGREKGSLRTSRVLMRGLLWRSRHRWLCLGQPTGRWGWARTEFNVGWYGLSRQAPHFSDSSRGVLRGNPLHNGIPAVFILIPWWDWLRRFLFSFLRLNKLNPKMTMKIRERKRKKLKKRVKEKKRMSFGGSDIRWMGGRGYTETYNFSVDFPQKSGGDMR